jgi:hypothetical protein
MSCVLGWRPVCRGCKRFTRTGIITAALGAFALSLLLVAAATGAAPAGATTTGDCQAQIAALKVQTQNATFTSQNAAKDQAGLIGKLDAASAALSAGKTADAIRKLTDFRAEVDTLNRQGKSDPDDAAALISGAEGAIACIQGIGA